MEDFKYKISFEQDKDEYDKNWSSTSRIKFNWLCDNVGDSFLKGWSPVGEEVWTNDLSYPGPGLISVDYYFKNHQDAMLFALRWGGDGGC